ncbi:MAG: Unknown protein [uncultured Sulfurovum sp.]|uniref:Uncharacterized protein n=1 Tax=uncultured Sulfurovum sp. TaxID=269237 RepID=A0A6S6SKD3_9BACT|nr:MAG: Unknown protein [uncultured Sulfurovum sp.]
MKYFLSEDQVTHITNALGEINTHAKKIQEEKAKVDEVMYAYIEEGAAKFFEQRENYIAEIMIEGLFGEDMVEDILFEQTMEDNLAREKSYNYLSKLKKNVPVYDKDAISFEMSDIQGDTRASNNVLGPSLKLLAASVEYDPEYLQIIKKISDEELYLEDIVKAYSKRKS